MAEPYTLQDFYFGVQPSLAPPLIAWLKAWRLWQREYLATFGRPKVEKPLPFLYISGPRDTGKTRILARGVGRFVMLSLKFATVQYIHWPHYINARLANGEEIEGINWDASLVILDGLDEDKFAQNHPSSWKLTQVITPLKNRLRPVLILANRPLLKKPKAGQTLFEFVSTTSNGATSPELTDFSEALISAIERNLFAEICFTSIIVKNIAKHETLAQRDVRLRAEAHKQDLKKLGFNFWLGDESEVAF
jgi:hypothetical protein